MHNSDITIESGMTLRKMLENNSTIDVPIIQRDYAQGRKSAEQIRKDFLVDIFDHLKKRMPMKLSFAYGTHNANVYVPYDGQQRITLIFLLSLFLAAYGEKWDILKDFARFRYYTRDYATSFCDFLTRFDRSFADGKNNVFQRIDIHSKNTIKEDIELDSSFFGAWKNDPTVASMLEVLQSIQSQFVFEVREQTKDQKIKTADEYLKFIDDGGIFFDWCALQASDNIYIKMNGRGKPLSAFDNFKNTLYVELDKLRTKGEGSEKISFLTSFEIKVDGTWTHLFWKNRNAFFDGDKDIAPYIMNFLFFLFELRYNSKTSNFYFGSKESFKWIDEKNIITFLNQFKRLCDTSNGSISHLSLDDYIWISKIMDILSSDEALLSNPINIDSEYITMIKLMKDLSNHKERLASPKAVFVASIYFSYLVAATDFDDYGNITCKHYEGREQWLELIRRIIRTAGRFKGRYDSLIDYKHFLYFLDKILIPKVFEENRCGKLNVFASKCQDDFLYECKTYLDASHVYSQFYEEIIKYRLIAIDTRWEELISKSEKELPFFGNMIYFLIALSEENGVRKIDLFSRYLDITKSLVNDKGIIDEGKFTALLLSCGDYRISSGEGYSNSLSLCSNESDESFTWRHFFDLLEGRTLEKTKLTILREAYDIIVKYGSLDAAFAAIGSRRNDSSWRSVIIRYPEVLKNGSKHRIVHQYNENWYLVKSDAVKKQVHSNSLSDSINLELYGLYRDSGNDCITFDVGKIIVDDNTFITKENDYVIHEGSVNRHETYENVLLYLKQ